MTGPKILFWDIETSPVLVSTWYLFQDSNSHENIIEDWKIICAAWKWQSTLLHEILHAIISDGNRD